MTITRIEATYLEIPLPADFHPSWVPGLAMQHNRCMVVQIHDDSGHTGIGAGTVFEQQQAEIGAYVAADAIGRFLIGADSAWVTGQVINVDGGHSLRRGPSFLQFAEAMHPEAIGPTLPPK